MLFHGQAQVTKDAKYCVWEGWLKSCAMFIVYHIIDLLITLQVFSVDEVLRCEIVHTWNKGTKVHETLPKVQTKAAYLMNHKQEQ